MEESTIAAIATAGYGFTLEDYDPHPHIKVEVAV